MNANAPTQGLCSPHARGWTDAWLYSRAVCCVFPACAGMDRLAINTALPGVCVPRMRGDGPNTSTSWRCSRKCSPHARGWTRSGPASGSWPGVFPACAGMDRARRAARKQKASVPRMRGDGPGVCGGKRGGDKCSPHARGWTGHEGERSGPGPVFPACAGMDRPHLYHEHFAQRVPRMRGDGPQVILRLLMSSSCSPHARGWTAVSGVCFKRQLVFPACAGMDRPNQSSPWG